MKNKKVSIILPTYNRAHIIKKSIDSILHQTYENFELIIVDDGSNDNTEQVVENIKDSRLIYHKYENNRGPSKARNVGIELALGQYIAFADSDDVWRENKLSKQMELINNSDYKIVYCPYALVKGKTSCRIPSDAESIVEGNIFEKLLCGNLVGAPTLLLKKECLETIGGYNEDIHSLEDWELVLRLSKVYEIGFVNDILVDAYWNADGVGKNWCAQVHAILYIIEKYRQEYKIPIQILEFLFGVLVHIKNDEILQKTKEKLCEFGLVTDISFDLLIKATRSVEKINLNNQLLYKFNEEDKLNQFIKIHHLNTTRIAIYGFGQIGKAFNASLCKNNINVAYVIDKKHIEDKTISYLGINQIEGASIDIILVTVPLEFDEIKKFLEEKTQAKIIDISDMLFL